MGKKLQMGVEKFGVGNTEDPDQRVAGQMGILRVSLVAMKGAKARYRQRG